MFIGTIVFVGHARRFVCSFGYDDTLSFRLKRKEVKFVRAWNSKKLESVIDRDLPVRHLGPHWSWCRAPSCPQNSSLANWSRFSWYSLTIKTAGYCLRSKARLLGYPWQSNEASRSATGFTGDLYSRWSGSRYGDSLWLVLFIGILYEEEEVRLLFPTLRNVSNWMPFFRG